MGRGRQKAKNTRAARELKYYSPSTDYSALEAELNQKAEDDYDESAETDDDRLVELEDE
ncbi:MAG: DUF3073 family protein [Aquiluna sp.]